MTDNILFGSLCAVLVLAIFYGGIRIFQICKVTCAFIDKRYDLYRRLPDYDAMLLGPQYLHLWTYGQWLKHMEALA